MNRRWWTVAVVAVVLVVGAGFAARLASAEQPVKHISGRAAQMVIAPETDRFSPFKIVIHDGDKVTFKNTDTDDHTIVSDDAINDGGPRGINMILPGTESNGGAPGQVSLRFGRPGTWVFYCRFHSHLGDDNQPVAPGPDGGIEDAQGNLGVPMMGIVEVLPKNDKDND